MKQVYLTVYLTIFCAFSTLAQGDFITVKELSSKLNNPNCIVIDARKSVDYKKVHIRNAISLPVEELSSKTPIEGILLSDTEVAKILGAHGINLKKEIIIYCNKGSSAGRMYWIFKMMGAQDVKLLDGNLDAWKAARKPVTRTPKITKKTTVTASLNRSACLSQSDVKSKIKQNNVVLVDARKNSYYNGTDPKSKGHIKGAVNINSDLMRDDKGLIKSSDELQKLFSSKGVTPDKEVILYCQTSTRAGLLYAILTTRMGYTNVKVYDGAYNDWVVSNTVVK
ncbi:sulfurtransferase [Labilibacter sediminis]|nr:sulfurtransferase [Labilibacter sediminis]